MSANYLSPPSTGTIKKSLSNLSIDSTTCSICLDKFDGSYELPCKHKYCLHCIMSWQEKNNTCPLCSVILPVNTFDIQQTQPDTKNPLIPPGAPVHINYRSISPQMTFQPIGINQHTSQQSVSHPSMPNSVVINIVQDPHSNACQNRNRSILKPVIGISIFIYLLLVVGTLIYLVYRFAQ